MGNRADADTAGVLAGNPGQGRILVVDEGFSPLLGGLLEEERYEVALATNAFRGLELLGEFRPQVVLTELSMPGLDGLAFLEKARLASPVARIVVLTASGSVDSAVEAMKRGADDFVEKPIDVETFRHMLRNSVAQASLLQSAHAPQLGGADSAAALGVVAGHPLMRAAFQRAEQVAPSRATILISGESGTGKGLLAESVHRMSDRAKGPFVELSCAALAESLLETELFGHERGSFTGAVSRHEGRFKHADGGTLFLDEIASSSLATQVKLLRFLQTRRFERVGGNKTLTVDVRLIAATNMDLRAEVAQGRFREDLFYRLNVFQIDLPPLRNRRSDIPALATNFLKGFAAENGRQLEGFSREALDLLTAHDWPGNVRELEHAVEHAAILARRSRVMPRDLPEAVRKGSRRDPLDVNIPGSTLAEIERAAILKSMMAVGGRATKAAAMLGISKSKIYYRLRDYGRPPSSSNGNGE